MPPRMTIASQSASSNVGARIDFLFRLPPCPQQSFNNPVPCFFSGSLKANDLKDSILSGPDLSPRLLRRFQFTDRGQNNLSGTHRRRRAYSSRILQPGILRCYTRKIFGIARDYRQSVNKSRSGRSGRLYPSEAIECFTQENRSHFATSMGRCGRLCGQLNPKRFHYGKRRTQSRVAFGAERAVKLFSR